MPYKRGQMWVGQVRKQGVRREKKFSTKKEAQSWESEMRRKSLNEWKRETVMVCLGDWAQAYLDFAEDKFVPQTYEEKVSVFKRLFTEVSPALPVASLTRKQVLTYIQHQKKLRSGYAANKDRKNLHAAWNWGIEFMDPPLPDANPCKVPKMPEKRSPRYIPPEEDFWRVYGIAEGQDKVMLLTFLHLAARRKEIFRMRWDDVDMVNHRIRLWTRKRKDGAWEYDWLPMTVELQSGLQWWRENTPMQGEKYVFLCLDQTPFAIQYYGKPFRERVQFMRRLCDRAGVKRFGFHAIRHLTATILYKKGKKPSEIQLILRHKNPNTTSRYLRTLGVEDVRSALEDLPKPKKAAVDYTP